MDIGEHPGVEHAADHARHLERDLLRGPKPVDASGDDAAQRVRQLVGGQRVGSAHETAFPVHDLQHALVTQAEGQLLREHRVPLGAILHQLLHGFRQPVDPEAPANHGGDIVVRKGRQRDALEGGQGEEARERLRRIGAERPGRDHEREPLDLARDPQQHGPRRRVEEARVADDDQQRGLARRRLQQAHEEVLRLLRACLAGEASRDIVVGPLHRQHGFDQGCQLDQSRIGWQQGREAGPPRAGIGQLRIDRVEPIEDAPPGAVGDRHLQRVGGAHQGEDVAVFRERQEVPQQACLSHADFGFEEDAARRALAPQRIEPLDHRRAFGLPA